jgi:hypothetical protein
MRTIAAVAELDKKQKPDFLEMAKNRKNTLLPQLRAAIPAFNYICGDLDNLGTLRIEQEQIDYKKGEGMFSGITLEQFQRLMEEVETADELEVQE